MKRDEFLVVFVGLVMQRSSQWLPEESTEEFMLNTMQNRLKEHNHEIQKVLGDHNERNVNSLDKSPSIN